MDAEGSPANVALTTTANTATGGQLETLQRMVADHYAEMRRVAGRLAAREPNSSPSPTDLVHEAYLRLIDQQLVTARGRAFFIGCFARECRRILVDHARARRAARRGGKAKHESFRSTIDLGRGDLDLLVLSDTIEALTAKNERMGQIVDMRVFGGLTVAECAEVLGIAVRTVEKDWTFARTWLRKELG